MTFHMIALCIALYLLLTLRTALVLRYLQIVFYIYTYCSAYGEDVACQCTTRMQFLLLRRVDTLYPYMHLRTTTLCPVDTWHLSLILCLRIAKRRRTPS